MIDQITIENYKSIEKLTLKLGRVNVLIGENGCGKSNILEAITLYFAAVNNKLDNEFLVSRGIRVTSDPKFMRSAFKQESVDKEIKIEILGQGSWRGRQGIMDICILQNDNESPYSKWIDLTVSSTKKEITKTILDAIENQPRYEKLNKESLIKFLEEMDLSGVRQEAVMSSSSTSDFLIYSPENAALRTFIQEGQILPLGIKGEGLFQLIKVLCSDDKYSEKVKELKEGLGLISWFKDFQLPDNLSKNEHALNIQDKYIDPNLKYFDQNSANEGFLFLLFYFCLFISDQTPSFFAIDNIDASLNPKLCRELMKQLIILAQKYNKQVILTTHNPAILDGLNLDDENQKLFIISRNSDGHTKARQFVKPQPIKGAEPVKLSEAFLRGYIGGLPKNF